MSKRDRIGDGPRNVAKWRRHRASRQPRPSQLSSSLHLPPWHHIKLPPFEKNWYREHANTALRSDDEVDHFRKSNGITVKGDYVPKPIFRASEAILPDSVIKTIEDQSTFTLTAVQAQCWPVALQGRDLLVTLQNSPEGKTLAYLVPAIVHAMNQPPVQPGDGPIAVVLVSVRETARLAQQAASKFETHTGVRSTCVVSRDTDGQEDTHLKRSNELCVATPGRLLSLLQEGKVNLSRCTVVVVDELDRMLLLGLEPVIRQVFKYVRPNRQTLVWAAAPLSMDARAFAMEICVHGPVEIIVETPQGLVDPQVRHDVRVCGDAEKMDAFAAICEELFDGELADQREEKAIVFADSAQTVDDLTRMIRRYPRCVIGVHGHQAAGNRQWAINAFRVGWYAVLVTTGSVSRKLDTSEKVQFVVNYDYPGGRDEYIRRTSLATSAVYTIFTPRNYQHAEELKSILDSAKQEVSRELVNMGVYGRRNI
ncbi:putative ATP-dependent RNA helicase DDX5 [Rhipicephalus microplus]|uniref:putative ATP-dependent RNA helicase DDX5 n=1 Tax=Rhipicephalus microplus TaxID=6941 RepID=UPI003F6A9A3F